MLQRHRQEWWWERKKNVITNYTLISFFPVTLINGLIIVTDRSCAITTTTTDTTSSSSSSLAFPPQALPIDRLVQLGILKNEQRCDMLNTSTILFLCYAHEFQAFKWNFPNSHNIYTLDKKGKKIICQSFQVEIHWIQSNEWQKKKNSNYFDIDLFLCTIPFKLSW